MKNLSSQTVKSLQSRVDASCADRETGIPGAVVVIVDRDGKEQFAYAGGKRGYGSKVASTF